MIIGFDECFLGDGPLYRLDVTPEVVAKKGISISSGNEDGVNKWWRPGGKTYPGGVPEAVIDPVPKDKVTLVDICKTTKETRMETIYLSQKDMLEICQDGDKYFLRYPTFNITMPEVVQEIPKEAVDSYLAGEYDGEELINYANFGFWKSKISQEDANIQFLRDNPEFLLIDTDRKRHYFSEKEFKELLKKAHEVSDADDK